VSTLARWYRVDAFGTTSKGAIAGETIATGDPIAAAITTIATTRPLARVASAIYGDVRYYAAPVRGCAIGEPIAYEKLELFPNGNKNMVLYLQ